MVQMGWIIAFHQKPGELPSKRSEHAWNLGLDRYWQIEEPVTIDALSEAIWVLSALTRLSISLAALFLRAFFRYPAISVAKLLSLRIAES